eukprot:SAG31_NODE_1864_length_7036_cov_3.477584_9_plen_134_part_00
MLSHLIAVDEDVIALDVAMDHGRLQPVQVLQPLEDLLTQTLSRLVPYISRLKPRISRIVVAQKTRESDSPDLAVPLFEDAQLDGLVQLHVLLERSGRHQLRDEVHRLFRDLRRPEVAKPPGHQRAIRNHSDAQ